MLTIYKASAGSGKTFTLAKEYIHTLLGVKDKFTGKYSLRASGHRAHRKILAITFSVKATDEMKRRIIDELANLADLQSESDYRDDFMTDFRCSAEQLSAAATDALNDLLFDFSFFNVSTIDSFFQSVLRNFAREIDLTGNYEVELEEKLAIEAGVSEMFSSLNHSDSGSSRNLGRWLALFMRQKIDTGSSFNLLNRNSGIHGQLVATLSTVMNEDFRSHSEEIKAYFEERPDSIIKMEKALREIYVKARKEAQQDAERALNLINRFGGADAKIVNNNIVSKIIAWAADNLPTATKDISVTVEKGALSQEKRYYAAYYRANTPPPELDEAIAKVCAGITPLFERWTFAKILLDNLYTFGLLGQLLTFIARYREDNNIILISDTNELLRRIISDDITPFIYEKLGYFLEHFMIDEFQDTSRMQWQNLMPLLLESLANNNDNLIIGDEKQCIYRFRNSNPELLAHQAKDQILGHLPESIRERGIEVADNTNWRSSAEVVRFNNTIFSSLADISGASSTYSNTIQQVSKTHIDHAGYVDLTFFNDSKGEDFIQESLANMAANIKRQLSSGYRPRDIAVLVRRHSEGEQVIDYLLGLMEDADTDFPTFSITSGEAMCISSSPLVKLIISVLRIIDSSDSTTSKANVSTRRLAQLVNRFEYFCNNQGLDASEALRRAIVDDPAIDALTSQAATMVCPNLPSLVERIIGTFISERQCELHNIYISAFQDLVIDFCSRGLTDIHSFLEWWDNHGKNTTLSTPSDLDALTVITIHASKGLQYRCVHVPFVDWKMIKNSTFRQRSYSWYTLPSINGIEDEWLPPMMPVENIGALANTPLAPQYEDYLATQRVDNLNLLYVAFTRAIDELIVATRNNEKDLVGVQIEKALGRASGDGSQWTIDLASRFDGEHLTVGAPTTKRAEASATDSDEDTAIPQMVPYFTVPDHNAWTLTRLDDYCDLDSARQRGIFMHDVLSLVRRRDDLQLAVRRRAYRIGLSAEDTRTFYDGLRTALSDPRVDRWFESSSRILNERTITLPDGTSYRPDRVVWTSHGTIDVVDYKFGEEHPSAYSSQVQGYMRHISEIFPDIQVRGFIWYPDRGIITPVELKH